MICCSRFGHKNTKHFCPQSGASIRFNFWKWSGEKRYQGALLPLLFSPFLSSRLTGPRSPRMLLLLSSFYIKICIEKHISIISAAGFFKKNTNTAVRMQVQLGAEVRSWTLIHRQRKRQAKHCFAHDIP